MNYFALTSIFIVISNSLMTVFMFVKGKNDFKHILLGIICLSASCWGVGGFMFSKLGMVDLGFRIGYIGVILAPPFFLHFVCEYLGLHKKKTLIFWYAFSLIFFAFSSFSGEVYWGVFQYVYGQFYWHDWFSTKSILYLVFYILNSWVLVPYSLSLLVKGYKQRTGKQAEQIKYLLIATGVGWLGYELMWCTDFHIYFYPYYNICLGVFPILIAYYVYKHDVLDITIAVQKGLIYSILIAIITGFYSILVFGAGQIFQGITGYQSFWLNVFVIFMIALLFNPIRDWIQHVLDKRLFHGTLESLEQDKQRLLQELFHKEKLAYVGQLASSVVHEIRNPITTIETFVECLPRKYGDAEFKEKFNRLVPQEIGRIKKIVNSLLGLAKQKDLVLKSVDVVGCIRGTLELLGEHFHLKQINVTKEFESDEMMVKGDGDALRQVFLNLLLNAVQAMEENGSLSVRATYAASGGSNGHVRIEISDTGCGISEEHLKDLFTPFRTTKAEGIGLGLSVTKEIVEQHKGTIQAKSQVGQGTTFILEFPRA